MGVNVTETVTNAHIQVGALMSTFLIIPYCPCTLWLPLLPFYTRGERNIHVHVCLYTSDFTAEKHPKFTDIFHSLDVWHKTCKLTAKLTEVLNMLHVYVIAYTFMIMYM